MPQIKVQNLYEVVVTESSGIPDTGDIDFTVSNPPTYTNGWIVVESENTPKRDLMYYHNVIGSRIYVRSENRPSPKAHTSGVSVKMLDVAEIFNFFSDMVSQLFYVEKTGGLTVKVWGGYTTYNGNTVTVADTNITLVDNATNYIKYDYPTNTISSSVSSTGSIKAVVTTLAGVITNISYRNAKESFIDFTVSLTGALPSQIGNAGKVLITDGTNVSWGSVRGKKSVNLASAGTVNLGAIDGDFVHITGTTTITSFGTIDSGVTINVVFDGALTLTHNGTSLILPGGSSITTVAGDTAIMISEGGGNWKCMNYTRASGNPLSFDITGLSADTVVDSTDTFPYFDGTTNKKITRDNLLSIFNKSVGPTISSEIQASSDSVVSTIGSAYTKRKEIQLITNRSGGVRMSYDMRAISGTMNARLYLNGTWIVPSLQTTTSASFVTYTYDIVSIAPSDIVSLWTSNDPGSGEVRNFRMLFSLNFQNYANVLI